MQYFSNMKTSQKIILASGGIALFSLFLPWAQHDLGGANEINRNGLEQQGYILLVLFVYPVLKTLYSKTFNKRIALTSSIASVIFSVMFSLTQSVDYIFLNKSVNVSAYGLHLYVFASCLLTYGIYKSPKNIQS